MREQIFDGLLGDVARVAARTVTAAVRTLTRGTAHAIAWHLSIHASEQYSSIITTRGGRR